MQLFKKKKLNLKEIHQLYLLLKDCLPEQEEIYLLDEVDKMLDKMTEEIIEQSLVIIYKNKITKNKSGIGILTLLIQGFKENDFFAYVNFIQGLNGGRNSKN